MCRRMACARARRYGPGSLNASDGTRPIRRPTHSRSSCGVDQRIEKWKRWIDGPIKSDVLTMHLQRDAYRTVSEMLAENADNLPESYWWEFMRDTYATTQAVAVRRQADTHKDVATLGKLIEEIRDDHRRITREFWLAEWSDPDDPFMQREAVRGWADQYAGDDERYLDAAIPASDLDTLTDAAADVRAYVDRHVAHSEKPSQVSAEITLTLKDVHDDIDVIGSLFKKYYNLLTASSFVMLVPVIQHDWLAAFRVAWMGREPTSRSAFDK
jgi:hypothetical protein